MHIICPHCTTFYGIDSSALGKEGRTVRCSRCKEVWLARSDDMAWSEHALMPMSTLAGTAVESSIAADRGAVEAVPVVESPPLAGEWQTSAEKKPDWQNGDALGWPLMALDGATEDAVTVPAPRAPLLQRLKPKFAVPRPSLAIGGVRTACVAMGAIVLALMVWRVEIVRLLPQTAGFYKLVGLDVNSRGLAFKDVKVASETVDGKPVLVIEGTIVDQTRKAVALPRLRFSVRDAQGAEIYAWNAVLEQSTLNPGEKAWFKSRLASPPAEGRSIDVRFFNKRDLAGGGA